LPLFFADGIASLLKVFSSRLGKIADQVDKLDMDVKANKGSLRLKRLRLRSRARLGRVVRCYC
jgi:hypothetical protein